MRASTESKITFVMQLNDYELRAIRNALREYNKNGAGTNDSKQILHEIEISFGNMI